MKKALNFILNQLGFIAIVVVLIMLNRGLIQLNWYSGTIIIIIFIAIFATSQLVWKSLQKDKGV